MDTNLNTKNNDYIKNFKDLKIWQKANSLEQKIEIIAKSFPTYEKTLKDQIVRSVRSIGANIAEGNSQQHLRKEINYINISLGSTGETRNHIVTAYQNNYISYEEYEKLDEELLELIKMMYGYLKALKAKVNNTNSSKS